MSKRRQTDYSVSAGIWKRSENAKELPQSEDENLEHIVGEGITTEVKPGQRQRRPAGQPDRNGFYDLKQRNAQSAGNTEATTSVVREEYRDL